MTWSVRRVFHARAWRWVVPFVVLFACLGASVARAEAEARPLRLSLSLNLVSHSSLAVDDDEGRSPQNELLVGITSSGLRGTLPGFFALGGSYRLTHNIGAGLETSFGYSRGELDYEGVDALSGAAREYAAIGTFMVRPVLELHFNESARWLVTGFAGLDVRYERGTVPGFQGGTSNWSTRGFGPAGGLAVRYFVLDHVSLDLVAALQMNFLKTRYEGGFEFEYQQLSYGLSFGASIWP